VNMNVGSADIGSSSSPFKGIYVTDGDDGDGNGVNDDIIGGHNAGAGQNLYADKGASSAKAYDLGDYNITLPGIDTVWLDDNSLDLTGTTQITGDIRGNSATDDGETEKGLIAGGALDLTESWHHGSDYYYPDIDQTDETNSINFDSETGVLTINGIIKVQALNISNDITYSGVGTIYVTGTTVINGKVLPNTDASYPTTNVFGVVSTGNMALGGSSQILLTGAYYSAGEISTDMQTELAGTIVCQNFDITNQTPRIWQVPSLAANLPPGMPGADPVWVFTERTWKDLSLE